MLVMDTGYHVVDDAVDGAMDSGWEVHRLPTQIRGTGTSQYVAELLKALVIFRPDFILSINHSGFDEKGALAQLLERYDMPLASWFVDHPMPILGGASANATSNSQLFCFERTAFPWLERNGYKEPVFLSTASNARYFSLSRLDTDLVRRMYCAVSFVGHSWWYKARVEPLKAVRKAARMLATKQRIDRTTVSGAFQKIIETGNRKTFGAAQVALADASMKSRQQFVNRLKELDLTLVGDEYWKNICPGIPVSPILDYHNELPAFYAASHVNMNITSEQMPTAVNQRVWDVPGVRGFLLTDGQEDARNVFEDGVSMAFYDSLDEAVSKASYYLEHTTERERIARRGMEIVEQSHRITHRMQALYDVMKKRFG
jgi:spore maturation protein CgeB